MTALFLISETQFGTTTELMDYSGTFDYLKDARKELAYHLNKMATSDEANELQPTMNFKDRFHFFVGNEKRHIVISKFYKSESRSIRMTMEAESKIKDISNPV